MDTGEAQHLIDQLLREQGDRGLGDVELASNRVRQRFSMAGMRAADNLLTKALRAIEDGDEARAGGYVRRAVELPFDEHEAAYPALVSAHMALFTLVTDVLEDCPEDDASWLDATLEVLASAPENARCDLRDVLAAIDHDYEIPGPERRRIRAAVVGIPPRAPAHALVLPAERQREVVTEVLQACAAYERALTRMADADHA